MSQKNLDLSKIRAFFWPIHRHELSKFVPMIILFFLISINYHLLRIAKDALVIPKGGAEAIPFLKVWAILPSAIFFTFLYTRLSNVFNREKVFYVIASIFLIFFIIFIFFLYPIKEKIFLDSTANYLQSFLPKGLNGFTSIIRLWIYSLFYIMAEAWSTIMLSVLLWGFANDVTKIDEAKRYYALFGIGVNSAGIFAGYVGSTISSHLQNVDKINPLLKFFGASSSWDQTLFLLVSLIILITIFSIITYRYLHLKFFKERASFANQCPITHKQKEKLSLRKNLKYLFKSKYLLSICVVVLSYNIIMNLSEVMWKSQMKDLFPKPGEYTNYMSKITLYTGIFATIGSYLISGSFIRKFGWKATALLTPIIEIITGLGFFYFLFVKQFSSIHSIWGFSPLVICVFFGSLQNIFSRSCKYTVFDSTKEMAFIPLSNEERLQGKSAIDGIGSRLGKSGSSFLLQIMLIIFSTTSACAPLVFIVFLVTIPLWMSSINSLGEKFNTLTKEKDKGVENLNLATEKS
jgi:ATP:ADP antiporter, AAA family